MHVLFCHDTFYTRAADERVYAHGAFPYELWSGRFLPHFDKVSVIGREKAFEPETVKALDISSGERVAHILYPNINAPLKRIIHGRALFDQVKAQVENADMVIVRGPSELGMMAAKAARQLGKPYAIEMSGCGFDHAWGHGSPVAKMYAPLKYIRVRAMVGKADQVIYVTEEFLQTRYPTKGHTAFASNVEIEQPERNVLDQRLVNMAADPEKIIFGLIGNFGNNIKGLGIALEALSRAKAHVPEFELRVLGQGNQARWQKDIQRYGLNGRVIFSDALPGGQPVLNWLDDIDIYLQPSFHEGLPRALIEAMSRGCPALGSNAGGIPELLASEFIHKKGDAQTLAKQIIRLVSEGEVRKNAAMNNFEKAQDYTKHKLAPRRAEFWTRFAAKVKEVAREK